MGFGRWKEWYASRGLRACAAAAHNTRLGASLRAKRGGGHGGPCEAGYASLMLCCLAADGCRCMYSMVEACLGSTGASSLRAVRKGSMTSLH